MNAGSHVWQPEFSEWKKLGDCDFAHKDVLLPPAAPLPHAVNRASAGTVVAGSAVAASRPGMPNWDEHWIQDAGKYPENLSLWGYFVRGFKEKYVDFSGRARPREYWGFILFSILAGIGLFVAGALLDAVTGNFEPGGLGNPGGNGPIIALVLYGLYSLAVFLPALAVAARRLHDWDMSAWWLLVVLVPYLGGLVFIVFMIIPSTAGANRFGPSPHGIRQS